MEKLEAQDKGRVIIPYIESYEKFKDVFKVELIDSEIQLFDETYWYAGTADKFLKIEWGGQEREALIDLKCGQPEWGYQFQLAGYGYAKGLHYSTLRLGVYLKKDGSLPQVIEYSNTEDFNIFLAATVTHRAKQRGKTE